MTFSCKHNSTFARLMGQRTVWWILVGLLLATLVFRKIPALDIEASRLFFDDGFFLAREDFWRGVRRLSITLTKLLVPLLLVLWILRLLRPAGNPHLPFVKLAFPTLSLLLGPVLVTNLIFKENWGRPRPKHLEVFGGDASFILPWDVSDQCVSNCSFVSGETSSAIWLFSLIPLLPVAWHYRALWLVALYTLVISGLRIAFGGHFLSDVVFSILLNGLVIWWVWGLFFERADTIKPLIWANETRAAGPLNRLGRPLRRIEAALSGKVMLAYSFVMDKVRRNS